MLGFLKRRWMVFSCTLVLVASTMVDLAWQNQANPIWRFGVVKGFFVCGFVKQGRLAPDPNNLSAPIPPLLFALHAPRLGGWPVLRTGDTRVGGSRVWIMIPIWLYLSLLIGWVSFRKMRTPKARPKAAGVDSEQPTTV